MQRAARKGSTKPRIYTPPLRELTPQTSLGFAAVEFATEVCGIDLYPWQRWLLIHALELAPELTVETMNTRGRLDPLFRFRRVVVLVARQNGKSTLSQVLSLFFMYVLGTPLVLGTAQDLDTAEEVWDGALDIIESTPDLAKLADRPVKNNGKKAIRLYTGERYKVKAANRKAGRGLSGDLILLDELREHQSWDAWAAITKTTMARPAAQIWALSNAGDATSVVLRYLRKVAHKNLGDPDGINAGADPAMMLPSGDDYADLVTLSDDDAPEAPELDDEHADPDTLGLFEWSAPPGCAVRDRDGWAWANPSLGYAISERDLAGDAALDDEWVFRTECLCQWSEGTLSGVFPPGAWDEGIDPESRVAPGGRAVLGLALSGDRSRAHIALAGYRADGRVHVGIIASRAGVDWVADYLTSDAVREFEALVVQERGAPESSLVDELERVRVPVRLWGGPHLTNAHGNLYDAVAGGEDGPVRHRPQPVLDVAVTGAVPRTLAGAWVLDLQKSISDAAPLKAVIAAYWGLTGQPEPVYSAYENRGVLTI